tara:strand:+ start:6776 stop:7210 length:435 start_codon:yes stop_codon:yes gene_type:complete
MSALENTESKEIYTESKEIYTESKEIYTEIPDRDTFLLYLKQNPGIMVFKFGAKWCRPCKFIENDLEILFTKTPKNVLCFDIDVDECFDVYSFLKSKKQVNGIPAVLCYIKGNTTFAPNFSHTGSDLKTLTLFFNKVNELANNI